MSGRASSWKSRRSTGLNRSAWPTQTLGCAVASGTPGAARTKTRSSSAGSRPRSHGYPGCPAERAEAIARHAGLRGSGRVGRSADGRALDERAVGLAVVASIRHEDTDYD